jgi:hypothetical protein
MPNRFASNEIDIAKGNSKSKMNSFSIFVLIDRCHTHSTTHAIPSGQINHCDALILKMKIRTRTADREEPSSTLLHSVTRCFPFDLAGEMPNR